MEKILSMIGLAHKAGRVEIGEEPVGSAARAKKARIILVAGDAAAGSVRRAMAFAGTGNCLCLVIPTTKEALGRALGRTSCAMAAITDMGFADAVAKKLAALEPEKFTGAAERMAIKAQRARERKLEQLAHEKNVRAGKNARQSPWKRPRRRNMSPGAAGRRKKHPNRPEKSAARRPEAVRRPRRGSDSRAASP